MSEHRRPNGKLAQGYYCSNCGQPCNMMGTGHRDPHDFFNTFCESNPKLVTQCRLANPSPNHKPQYVIPGVISE